MVAARAYGLHWDWAAIQPAALPLILNHLPAMATTASEAVPVDNYGPITRAPRPRARSFPQYTPDAAVAFDSSMLELRPLADAPGEALRGIAVRADEWLTRSLNVAVAAIALVVLSPLIALIATAVKLTSPGPVFYAQMRIGIDRRWNRKPSHQQQRVRDLGGRPFRIYKFRTMVDCAEPHGRAVWACLGDSRVTPLGRFLRASRLDELPQMWNVLRGDMNVVGPRPERPEIFAELREQIPHYHVRQRVMPGITGWAQINQSYDQTLEDVRRKVRLDLEYMQARSAWRDLSIMAQTVPVMVRRNLGW